MKPKTGFLALLCAALCFAAVPLSLAQATQEKLYDKSYALVIGISNYQNPDKWPTLNNAVNDAKAVAEYLKDTGFDVTPLTDKDAAKDRILTELANLAGKVKANDRVIVYFAGHGETKSIGNRDRGFIIPYDATGETTSFIDMRDLKRYSEDMGTAKHQLFIMDSCYGGSLGEDEMQRSSSSTADDDPPPKSPDMEFIYKMVRPHVRQVLTAGGKDQKVMDGDGGGVYGRHSMFTGALLDALKNKKADMDGDGFITFSELRYYIRKNGAVKDKQTPHSDYLAGHMGDRDFVFLANRRRVLISSRFERLDSSKDQHMLLERMGPKYLLKDLTALQKTLGVWDVRFDLQDSDENTQMRGGPGADAVTERAEQPSDYVMEVKYQPLDKQQIRVEATFKRKDGQLKEIPAIQAVLKSAADFKPLVTELLEKFAQDDKLHLHLDSPIFENCPPELEGEVRDSIAFWLAQLQMPGIKFMASRDDNSNTDVVIQPFVVFAPEGGRQVLSISLVVERAGYERKSLEKKLDPASWKTSLPGLQKQLEAYLTELVK